MKKPNESLKSSRAFFCSKNSDWVVDYQNPSSKILCGNMEGLVCDKGCRAICATGAGEGIEFLHNVNLFGHFIDLVLLKEKNIILSLGLSNDESIDRQFKDFAAKGLSKRELEVVALKFQDHSNEEISKILFISRQTVKTHLNNIYKKLGNKVPFNSNFI